MHLGGSVSCVVHSCFLPRKLLTRTVRALGSITHVPARTLMSPGSRESSGTPCSCSVRLRPQCPHTITGIIFHYGGNTQE